MVENGQRFALEPAFRENLREQLADCLDSVRALKLQGNIESLLEFLAGVSDVIGLMIVALQPDPGGRKLNVGKAVEIGLLSCKRQASFCREHLRMRRISNANSDRVAELAASSVTR